MNLFVIPPQSLFLLFNIENSLCKVWDFIWAQFSLTEITLYEHEYDQMERKEVSSENWL